MFKLTEREALDYIHKGEFPKTHSEKDLVKILDLQDAFGHLPYKFVYSLLYVGDETFTTNAESLFRTIWCSDDVDHMARNARYYRGLIESKKELKTELIKVEREIMLYEYYPSES